MAEKKLELDKLPNNSVRKRNAEEYKKIQKAKQTPKTAATVVSAKKPSIAQRFAKAFIAEDVDSVGSYIVSEVIIPAVKDTIADVATTFIEQLLFGSSSGYSTKKSKSSQSVVSYQKFYDDNQRVHARKRNRAKEFYSPATSNGISPGGQLIIEDIRSRKEAEDILDKMSAVLDEYDMVSVADVYEMAGVDNSDFTNNNYGWNTIESAQIHRAGHDSYSIILPSPIHLA